MKLFQNTLNDNIWLDVFDWENGTNLKVYLKGQDYYIIGGLKNMDENGDDSWLVLNGFAKYDVNTNQNYKNEPSYIGEWDVKIAVRMADVEHIEIF